MRKEVIAHKDPKSPISEVFRTLRTNIQFMNMSKKMKTLLVTSTVPREGKSWVASNLAVTFAQAGKKVVLVDADMRKGRQYAIFGVSPRPGLSNYLSQVEIDENQKVSEDIVDYIQETEVQNLYLMSAGNIPPNPSELLVSSQMINLLEELKEICDIVIIDGTPSELVTDSIILSRIVDCTIVVTAYNLTKKEALERVIKNIQNVGGKLAGVVVNKMPMSGKKYEQKYYYYGKEAEPSKKKRNAKGKRKVEEINKQRITRTIAIDKEKDTPLKPKMERENKGEKQDLPRALKKEIKTENAKEISIERTTDILKQINDYIDKEKKNLNS